MRKRVFIALISAITSLAFIFGWSPPNGVEVHWTTDLVSGCISGVVVAEIMWRSIEEVTV